MAGPNGSRELAYMHTGNVIDIGAPGRPPAIHWVIVSLELQTLTIRDADGMEVKLQRAQE